MELISKLLNTDTNTTDTTFQLNEVVYVSSNALWSNGKKVPDWVQNTPMYVRNINKDNISISIYKEGIITGTLNKQYLYKKSDNNINTLKSYKVKITANLLNVRSGPSMEYEVTRIVKKDDIYNIIDEQNGWGKLDSNLGWIALNYTRKV